MSANQPRFFTIESAPSQETPLELAAWDTAGEPLLPARHVVWVSVAMLVVTLGALIFG